METYDYALQNDAWYKVLTAGGSFQISAVTGGLHIHSSASDTPPISGAAYHNVDAAFLNGISTFSNYPSTTKVWLRAADDGDQTVTISRVTQ